MGTVVKDSIFWVLTSLAVLAAFYFQYVNTQQALISLSVWVAAALFVLVSLRFTSSGQSLVAYFKQSKQEIQKVIWPSKRDIIMTTIVVGFSVAFIAFMITLLDSILVWVLSSITS
jgi:preprotein translocase subunit SecE